MNLTVKQFYELTIDELWQIYHIRAEVFVVEQNCVYQDIDRYDKEAYHLWLSDEDGMQAYARVLPAGTAFEYAAIGRVISMKRRAGLGTKIVSEAIRTAQGKFGADRIVIEAQVYARELYEKLGFRQVSEEFLEDGIPHIKMIWEKR